MKNISIVKGGVIIDHKAPRERRFVVYYYSAVHSAEESVKICKQYDIGQNTRLSEILLVDLYAESSGFDKAMKAAKEAWNGATGTGSRYEMAIAAYKIVKLLLWRREYQEAETFMDEYRKDAGNAQFVSLIDDAFNMMLKQVRSGKRGLPSASGLLGTLT